MADSTSIDSAVFTVDFKDPIKTLEIYSEDIAKAGSYEIEVRAFYDDFPSV